MLKALLIPLLLIAAVANAQTDTPPETVTLAQLEGATAQATENLAADDPLRKTLLNLYTQTRAALEETDQYKQSQQSYAQARAGAAKKARDIEAGLAERVVSSDQPAVNLAEIPLKELEQRIQVDQAELEARKTRLSDTSDAINGMPARSMEIQSRLTELGKLIPDLEAQLELMPASVQAGGEKEAALWLAQAQVASARAEKAMLDEELLSQPMRLQLLKAQQDQASHDITLMTRRLEAMERRASDLRQGEASEARAAAEKAVADTEGKHRLVQQMADDNAALTASFELRNVEIERARQRNKEIAKRAERFESDLQSIERKLDILGMSARVGHILREQEAQLPRSRDSKKEIVTVAEQVSQSSVRQLELEDERRQLLDAGAYVDNLIAGQTPQVAAAIRDDLLELARKRRELVSQAVDLENTYAGTLGDLALSLQRYRSVVKDYRDFISERLLWIPSRNPFSVFTGEALPKQLAEVLVAERWLQVLSQLPRELAAQPVTILLLLVALVLILSSSWLRTRLIATGTDVGYVRSDLYSNTLLALLFSLLLSLRWPLLMWIVARLFEVQEVEAELATALHKALSSGAMYFWGLEFLRVILWRKGLFEAHFRWPQKRTASIRRRVLRLEQTFLPAAVLVVFSLTLYPADVGGPLAAVAVIIVLLSIAHFFRQMPHFMRGKLAMVLNDSSTMRSTLIARLIRQLLFWVPLATIVAVLFGYIYTAMEFSLLLIKSIVLFCVVLLSYELGLRWLRMTRRRMVVKVRQEAARASADDEAEARLEEDILESDPELLNDQGTKLLNVLILLAGLAGILAIWAEVFPALGILDSVQLWHQTGVVDGREVPVPVTLKSVVIALAVAVVGWLALNRIPRLLEIFLRQKMGVRPATAYAATRVLQYAITAALVVLVLSFLGGRWSQIQWAVAALSVGIGFGLQEIVANFISGLIILFEQPVRVGDTVTVGGVSGRVTKIRIRATTIRDFDRRELLVPNKEFITQQLLNWSLSDQVTRWVVEVGVAYGTNLDKAMAIVQDAIRRQPLILAEPEPMITFDEFGDNSLMIRARFFMEQLDKRLEVASSLRLDINRHFNEEGIVVAFPQRDIHLDTTQPLAVRMLSPEQDERPGQGPV
jgi:potassium efflux system protein